MVLAFTTIVKRISLTLLLCPVVALLSAQDNNEVPFWKRPLLYDSAELSSNVSVIRGVNYLAGSPATLFDMYIPEQRPEKELLPVIIFVHGGPVPENANPREWRVYKDYGRLVARSGFVGITFNHRFHSYNDLEKAGNDIRELLAYLKRNAEKYSIDPSRVGVWLFSFGGAFVPIFTKDLPVKVKAIATYYGFLEPSYDPELSKAMTSEKLKAYSTSSALPALKQKNIRLQIVRCGKDFEPIQKATVDVIREVIANGVDFELVNYAEAVHGFDIRTDLPQTREVIRGTVQFFHRTFVKN